MIKIDTIEQAAKAIFNKYKKSFPDMFIFIGHKYTSGKIFMFEQVDSFPISSIQGQGINNSICLEARWLSTGKLKYMTHKDVVSVGKGTKEIEWEDISDKSYNSLNAKLNSIGTFTGPNKLNY